MFWILFLNSAFIMCHSLHSMKHVPGQNTQRLGPGDWAGTVGGAAEAVGHSFAARSDGRRSWGESLLLNSNHRVNRHMLPPAKHVEQLLLLAGNPRGAHTKSINCLLRWLCCHPASYFSPSQRPKSCRLCGILEAECQTLVEVTVVICPVDPNEAIQLKMGFI